MGKDGTECAAFGCRKRRKKVKVPNYAGATVRAAMTKNRRKNGDFISKDISHGFTHLFCFGSCVKYSCLMNIANTTSRMITSRISKITQIILNYFTFLHSKKSFS